MGYALLFFLIGVLWFIGAGKIGLSFDSYLQIHQAMSGNIDNFHPYLYTLFIRYTGTTHLWVTVVFQIILTSIVLGHIFTYYKQKIDSRIGLMLLVIVSTSVPIWIYAISIWKDVLYGIAVLYLTFLLINIEALESRIKAYALMSVTLIIAIYFRHNGIILALLVPILSIFLLQRKMALVISTITACIVGIFSFLLPSYLNITPAPNWISKVGILHQSIGFMVRQPATVLSTKTSAIIMSLYKDPSLLKYNPLYAQELIFRYQEGSEIIDKIYFNRNLNQEKLDDREMWDSLMREYFLINLPKNLPYVIGDKITQLFAIFFGYTYTSVYDDLALRDMPIYLTAHRIITWNLAIPFCIIMSFGLKFWRSHTKDCAIILSISGTLFLTTWLISPYSDWRYFYSLYLVGMILVPMVWSSFSRK